MLHVGTSETFIAGVDDIKYHRLPDYKVAVA